MIVKLSRLKKNTDLKSTSSATGNDGVPNRNIKGEHLHQNTINCWPESTKLLYIVHYVFHYIIIRPNEKV